MPQESHHGPRVFDLRFWLVGVGLSGIGFAMSSRFDGVLAPFAITVLRSVTNLCAALGGGDTVTGILAGFASVVLFFAVPVGVGGAIGWFGFGRRYPRSRLASIPAILMGMGIRDLFGSDPLDAILTGTAAHAAVLTQMALGLGVFGGILMFVWIQRAREAPAPRGSLSDTSSWEPFDPIA